MLYGVVDIFTLSTTVENMNRGANVAQQVLHVVPKGKYIHLNGTSIAIVHELSNVHFLHTEYVKIHWQEDAFFGYQFLNGCNPYMVSQSRTLPRKFPVTEEMVKTLLPAGTSLKLELEKGNIFLADYEVLQGVPANIVNGRQQFLTTPLCLLHKTEEGQLLPIAIQLNQTPGPQNPIFLPSDSEPDWLLAKIWVRNSDFFCHQILSHYLKTHMLGEIYCIATLRQLPEVHPLHKLIICHVWTTLQINIQARNSLLAKGGVFDKSIGCGLEGVGVLLQRGMSQLHYNDLCLPDDLRQRGLDQLASCYFAEDGLKVWGAIHRFVEKLLQFFYPSDLAVQNDIELQSWIKEIFTEGFLGQESKGFPQSFKTTAEVVKFVTMVIFTCSAQHAAVNFSQLDYNIWMPNCPATMGKPPPKVKGALQLEDILSYLPDVNATCSVLITLSLLSSPSKDFIPLGGYHEGIFSEETAQKLILEFQAELAHIVSEIKQRTTKLELPYDYLRPDLIENSVSI
ncbi:polyunsaturated fatty acid lipoxygenase ALOX15B-like [Polypterus senegalus]|uniref:polyunsaturated fatty acid lipoxygenase ALOX15B-like n=1 Tax=Polypterus senegalus TaxID=55291 RepID=UPI0019660FFB|nr:polyunsaturated fatty acid lipoxygenase ALOX15B-like [Polypterus senegalus]